MNRLFSLLLFSLAACLISPATLAQQFNTVDACVAFEQNPPANAIESVMNGVWSNPATWGGKIPEPDETVLVSHSVVVDQAESGQVLVAGHMQMNGTIDAYGSVIVCDGGRLSGSQGLIGFHVDDDRDFSGTIDAPDRAFGDIGIWALSGSVIDLEGPEVTSWTTVESTSSFVADKYGTAKALALSGGEATLSDSPTGWQVGDQLLLVDITGDNALATLTAIAGNRIEFNDPIFSGHVIMMDQQKVKPIVANLSRRLQVVSTEVVTGDTNHRAHSIFMRGSDVTLRHVEFRNMGPRGKLGRYPVHWHHAHESGGVLEGSSIWQDVDEGGSRFLTIHVTQNVQALNNVGFRSQGHGYFMEQIEEFDNTLIGNLSVDVRGGEELPHVHRDISHQTKRTAHFWVRQGNTYIDNVAAGHDWPGDTRHFPNIDGMIVLPSPKSGEETVVENFQALGAGGVGMWSAIPDVIFDNPKAVYNFMNGGASWSDRNNDGVPIFTDPLFLLNGSGAPWSAQIYADYGDVIVKGGILAGETGYHGHYNARFNFEDVDIVARWAIEPTYWELAGILKDVNVDSPELFKRPYPTTKRPTPGVIHAIDLSWDGGTYNGGFTHNKFSHLIPENPAQQIDSTVVLYDSLPLTGFIDLPSESSAKYWSVSPANSVEEEPRYLINTRVQKWAETLNTYKGYLHGFPPGSYDVRLYGNKDQDEADFSATVEVYEGLLTTLCQGEEICTPGDAPAVAIISPGSEYLPSGMPVSFSGFANDLDDGNLSDSISWSSSVAGDLGVGESIESLLADGFHQITATVVDSDNNQAVKNIGISVGGSYGGTGIEPAVEQGVSVFVASADCNDGLDPHWQCEGVWASTDSISEDAFVAFCPTGISKYEECVGSHEYRKFSELADTDAIGACVGAVLEGETRGECANTRIPGGSAVHKYLSIAEIFVQEEIPEVPEPEEPEEPEVPEVPEPEEPEVPNVPGPVDPDNPGDDESGSDSTNDPEPTFPIDQEPEVPGNPTTGGSGGSNNDGNVLNTGGSDDDQSDTSGGSVPDSPPPGTSQDDDDGEEPESTITIDGSLPTGPGTKTEGKPKTTIFNSGTIRDYQNNDVIIGGTLAGQIENHNGIVVNVTLAGDAEVTGGEARGILSGTGVVKEVLLNVSELAPTVRLSYGTQITEYSSLIIGSMDLTGAVTTDSGMIDINTPFLVHANGSDESSILDLVTNTVAPAFEVTLGADNTIVLTDTFSPSDSYSLYAAAVSSGKIGSGSEFNANGDFLVSNRGVEITFVSTTPEARVFTSLIAEIDAEIVPVDAGTLKIFLDGATYLVKFGLEVTESEASPGVARFEILPDPRLPGMLRVVVDYGDGFRQSLIPYPHDLDGFESAMQRAGLQYSIDPESGVVNVVDLVTGQSFSVTPDFLLETGGQASGEFRFVSMGDVNGDGTEDFQLTGGGDFVQMFYGLSDQAH